MTTALFTDLFHASGITIRVIIPMVAQSSTECLTIHPSDPIGLD
jgi:hypothetical protein